MVSSREPSPTYTRDLLTRLTTRHGRDNKIHYFHLPSSTPSISGTAATAVPSPKDPTPLEPTWSLNVNALAYCKMSLLRLLSESNVEPQALVAVPALTKDGQVRSFVSGRSR